MSDKSTATDKESNGGCIRIALLGLIAVFAMVIAGGVAFMALSLYTVDQKILEPVQALVRGMGIGVTPEVRPDPITIVREINNLAQLQTASYSMEKIVTAKRGTDDFFGVFEDSLIFVAVGQVTAGIDLAKLVEGDIQATSFQTATIRLPDAEVFISALDNEMSYVADRDTGLLAAADSQMETLARQAGEEAILEAALEQGVLELAEENAQTVLAGLLQSLGFEAVVFVKGDMPNAIPIDNEIPKGFILTPSP